MVSAVCWIEGKMINNLKQNKRLLIISCVFGLLYSAAFAIGRSIYNTHGLISLFSSFKNILISILLFVLCFVVSTVIFALIMLWLDKQNYGDKKTSIKNFFILMFVIIAVYSSALFALYPGVYSYDMMSVNRQATGVYNYDRFQPPLFTLLWSLFSKLSALTGAYASTLYAIFQIILVACFFSSLLLFIKKRNYKIYCISLIFVILNPVFAIFSIIPTKDVPFSVFFGWTILLLYLSLKNASNKNIILLSCSTIICSLFRNNMIYAVIVFAILSSFYLYKNNKKVLAAMVISILSVLIINGPIMDLCGVEKGNSREKLSIPIQQISLIVNRNKDKLDEETKSEISKFFYDFDSLAELYNPRFADDVKELFYTEYYDENKMEFWNMYLQLLVKYPNECIVSFLDLNIPLWYQNSSSIDEYSNRDYIEINIFENVFNRDSKLPALKQYYENIANYSYFAKIPNIINIFSISTPFWLMLFCLMKTIYKKESKNIIVVLLMLLLWSTYLLGPVSNCRYMLPFMTMYPLLIMFLFGERNQKTY